MMECHYASMNVYSEDRRKKIVEAVERGTSKTEVARAFGVVRLVAQGQACLRPRAAQLGQQCYLLAGMTREGMGTCVAVEGPTTKVIFETYVQERRR